MPRGYAASEEWVLEHARDGDLVAMANCFSKRRAKIVANALLSYLAGSDTENYASKYEVRGVSVYVSADRVKLEPWEPFVRAHTRYAAVQIARALNVYRPRKRGGKRES